jgi:ATP-dependent protease ClpP protease subunit
MVIWLNSRINHYKLYVAHLVNAHHTLNSKRMQVMEDTDRDFFMSAREALDYGLIDHIIEHPTDIAVRASGIPMYASEL